MNIKGIIIKALILYACLLLSTPATASYDFDGYDINTVKHDKINGGIYAMGGHGLQGTAYQPNTYTQNFNVPSGTVDWARLYIGVWGGSEIRTGWLQTTFNGNDLGNITLLGESDTNANVYCTGNGVNWIYYDVTSHTTNEVNSVVANTGGSGDLPIDGRIYGAVLIAAYEDESKPAIEYWINEGNINLNYLTPKNTAESAFNGPVDSSKITGADLYTFYLTGNIYDSDSLSFNSNLLANDAADGSGADDQGNSWTDDYFDAGINDVWNVENYLIANNNKVLFNRVDDSNLHPVGAVLVLTTQEEMPDLTVTDISAYHNDYNGVWEDIDNTVDVVIENQGVGTAGSFKVKLLANSIEVGTETVPNLAAGTSTTVAFTWHPTDTGSYTLNAIADSDSTIDETNETNNEFSTVVSVGHNGYIGDKPFTTYAHGSMKGNILYTIGDSEYSGKLYPKPPFPPNADPKYVVNHTVTIPEGATVKFARLYSYWTWSAKGSIGRNPSMSFFFDGVEISPDVKYDDRKGWGEYDFPAGTWAYDVTSFVTGNGIYNSVVRNIDPDMAFFCMDGIGLLVVYEDPNGKEVEYWINEGADILCTMGSTSGGLTPQEATASSLFSGSIDLSNVDSAKLWTVVQSGNHVGSKLIFNTENFAGVYDGTPYADLDIDERDVRDYLTATDNTAKIEPPHVSNAGGDYLTPSSAFLMITYGGTPSPALSISADLATVTVGVPTDVNFTVTNNSELVEGATITLTGPATGSATTDTNGIAVISVNATGSGTITATATKDGFISATTTITAKEEHSGVSSSVSMTTNIIPAISLVVTPGIIEFGELSPGDTSGTHILTLNNTGGNILSVIAEVTDTADNLFVEGMLLDSFGWGEYAASIPALTSDTTDASLKVPDSYLGVGTKEGALVFWAEAE